MSLSYYSQIYPSLYTKYYIQFHALIHSAYQVLCFFLYINYNRNILMVG